MASRRAQVLIGCGVLALACTKTTSTPTPVQGPPATVTSTVPGQQPGAPVPNRRIPPSRDSLAKLRANYVAQIMRQIAGHENDPAEQVFKNVQVLKGITAAQLVHTMDKQYGAALSWNCTNCHRLANQGNWASDTSADKKRARFMQQMMNEINTVQLPKLYPRDTPAVTCATCHRGYNEPPNADYLIPERGKPGGLPLPPGRGGPPRGPGH